MRITEETLQELQQMGIVAKIYPDDYASFYQRCVESRFKWLGMYDDCSILIDGKIVKNRDRKEYLAEKQKDAEKFALKDVNDWYNADMLYIEYDGRLICKKQNKKNELITIDYILKTVEKDKKLYNGFYGDFTLKMKSLLKKEGLERGINVYPTTYGIGVCILWWHSDADINHVKRILDSKGIEYYNEYSDAQWVYRFKVSKKRENLEKL